MSERRPDRSFLNGRINYIRTTTRFHPERRISRRALIHGGLGTAAGLGASAWLKFGGLEHLKNLLEEKPTKEQQEAARLLAGNSNFFENIVSVKVEKDGKTVPINLRNKPRVAFDETDFRAGEVIGKLEANVLIKKAVQFEGNDPLNSRDKNSKSNWLAFYLPDDPNTVYFAWAGYFKPYIPGDSTGVVEQTD